MAGYGAHDLRSRLDPTTVTAVPGRCAAAQYFDFNTLEPDEITARGSRTWWVRGQNFTLVYAHAVAGEVFTRERQPDEYVVLFPTDPAGAVVRAGADTAAVTTAAMAVIPPGDSEVEVTAECAVVQLFSSASPELQQRARNRDDYREPHANVTPFVAWPDPVDGFRIRVYPIADHPYRDGRFGRLFRCSTFMVNLFEPDRDPRPASALSPHRHNDFEQCSLAVAGEYVHHIRTPWTPNLADWREDEHVRTASPSVAIIPPPSVHTSQSVSQVKNQLVDIFCPPRHDFSAQTGWVINAAEYPAPDPTDAP